MPPRPRDPITGRTFRPGFIGAEGKLRNPRSRIGTLGKRRLSELEGVDQLIRNTRLMSQQAKHQFLKLAVDQGALELQLIMMAVAPRSSTPGRGAAKDIGGHAADRIANIERKPRRDSRTRAVGLSRYGNNWWLKFPELGTIYQAEQPFMKPAANAMRKRMISIFVKHWRKAVRKLKVRI